MQVYTKDGKPVAPGEEVISSRGQSYLLVRATRLTTDDRNGRVLVATVGPSSVRREYCAGVFGLVVKDE